VERSHRISQEEKTIIRRTFAHIPGGPPEIHRLEALAPAYGPESTQRHIQAVVRYNRKPVSCGKLCGCEEMRSPNGGRGVSPVWFAYQRGAPRT